jgi:hypothetical protein
VLLQPPILPDGRADLDATLADWQVNGRFPTKEDCDAAQSMNLAAAAWGVSKDGGGLVPDVISRARCYSVDQLQKLLRPKPASGDPDLD